MRKVIVVMVLVLLLAACNQSEDSVEEVEVVVTPTTAAVAPPRIEATPTSPLPPTFTPSVLAPGGHISPVSTSSIHIIQPGDTLGELAKRYGVTVSDLARVNRIMNVDRIEVGHVLYIPPRE